MKMSGRVAFNVSALSAGRSALSSVLRVPVGCTRADVVIDGSAWPLGSKVKVSVQVRYGDKFKKHGEIVTSREELVDGRCHAGAFYEHPIAEEISVRGCVRVISGPKVDIVGSVICG